MSENGAETLQFLSQTALFRATNQQTRICVVKHLYLSEISHTNKLLKIDKIDE